MSIDIESMLMLVPKGVNVYDHLSATYPDVNDYWSLLDELGLDYASPYYDADRKHLVVGIKVLRPSYEDLLDQESSWWDKLNEAKDKLNKIFGDCDARLEDAPNVW